MVYNRGMMNITRTSIVSNITRTLELDCTPEQVQAWEEGELAQNAFPNLDASEREFVMTGITSEEWDEMFSEEIEN